MTLSAFLLARIAEDEAASDRRHDSFCETNSDSLGSGPCDCDVPARVLAECEAKRRIVEDFETLNADYRVTHLAQTEARRYQALVAMSHVALPYADHPDYRDEWKP